MGKAILTISSKNYGAWALRGWLMTRLSGIAFEEKIIAPDDPSVRADLLLLSSSIRVPALEHKGNHVWDTLAIGEYLNEACPKARLLPSGAAARAHCRSICGEMHSGFSALRSALPMNIKGDFPNFKVWSRAQADIDRIVEIWTDCLNAYGGPFLFGAHACNADAMFAPVVTRFRSYHVELPEMQEWVSAALAEPDEIDELDAEF